MKKYLIKETGNFYKANLHCHTTLSDGSLSPGEIKKEYVKKGYSVVAYTDHDILIDHSDLCDKDFIALNGFEVEINEKKEADFSFKKTCHICFVALDPTNLNTLFYHRSNKYIFGNAVNYIDQIKYDNSLPDYERHYTPECVSEMMKMGRDNGFFVTYNHPGWSMETYEQYSKYENMHAMEICNFACCSTAYTDYNEKEYSQMLDCGKRIYCIAADDNHNRAPIDSPHCDSFGGFTMIKAHKLDYKAITDALLNGDFYASQGPEIKSVWFEDGKINISCGNVKSIALNTGRRRTAIEYDETGEGITEASFGVEPDDGYVRLTITDKNGLHANTIAYFVDELL